MSLRLRPVECRSAHGADHGAASGEGDNRPAMQQPDQSGDVVTTEAPVFCRWPFRHIGKAEQVTWRPAKAFGLFTPPGKEASAVLNGVPFPQCSGG
jgi:hypothetical protein